MTIKIPFSAITPEHIYISRRKFLRKSLYTTAAAALLSACNSDQTTDGNNNGSGSEYPDEQGNPSTNYEDIINYTNYYEFSTDKSLPTQLAQNFISDPWSLSVGGLVNNPRTFSIEEIRSIFNLEERIYRMRCVEAWSMVIPWIGFPLAQLLDIVAPTEEAQFVRFETLFDPTQMPNQKRPVFPWPYIEGLRLDEAYHNLTLLATGLYGKDLTPQNGAPIRLVVPWKYGFKSIKSIVKIDLVKEMPISLWMAAGPSEYGFYANVNPTVHHPRWSQATERRIGESGRVETQMFNGYQEEVANLYTGMDLTINF